MATDKREAILSRLATIFEELSDSDETIKFFRNKIRVQENERPAVVMFDCDESTEESGFGRGRPSSGPLVVALVPEIYVYVGSDHKNIGTALNAIRVKVLKAVLLDDPLRKLLKDGDMRYQGCATGLAMGRSVEGEAGLSFAFHYVLNPTEL